MDEKQPDYRFLMANERTFLAYVRTALALQIAGLGVLQFLTHSHNAVRYALGLTLVAVGSYVGAAGYARYRANEAAIRAGTPMRRSLATAVVTTVVVTVPLVGAVVLALV